MFFRDVNESETVVRLLAAQVRRDIAFGVLEPDAKLKIDELRQRYGGSPHSLREALTQLANIGMVEAHPQRGFRVASATQQDLEDITRLLVEIEALGLSWAFARGDVRWEGEVMSALHRLSRVQALVVTDPATYALEWEEANGDFHVSLIGPCGSPRLLDFQRKLLEQSARFRLASLLDGSFDLSAAETTHKKILSAVLARDLPSAQQLLRETITQIQPLP